MANETSWFQFYWTCGSLHLQGQKRQALKPLHDDCAKEDVPASVLIGFERWRRAAEGEHHGIRHRIKSMLFTRWDSGSKRFHSHFWRHFASSKIRLSAVPARVSVTILRQICVERQAISARSPFSCNLLVFWVFGSSKDVQPPQQGLTSAVRSGIPPNLRGTMWPLALVPCSFCRDFVQRF